jgi:hypothetical protein
MLLLQQISPISQTNKSENYQSSTLESSKLRDFPFTMLGKSWSKGCVLCQKSRSKSGVGNQENSWSKDVYKMINVEKIWGGCRDLHKGNTKIICQSIRDESINVEILKHKDARINHSAIIQSKCKDAHSQKHKDMRLIVR